MSSITNCVLPNGHAPGAKRRKAGESTQERRKSTFLLKNSMADSWDLETVQMISKISIFIKNSNEELHNLSIFKKYSKFLNHYTDSDSLTDVSNNPSNISDILSTTENQKERFKLHALIIDQHYSDNKELLDILERNSANHQFRTCLLITPKYLTELIQIEHNNNNHNNQNTKKKPSTISNLLNDENSKVLPIENIWNRLDFSIFDHVIMLNDDIENAGDEFCSSVLGFQLYQFLQNCQREALARYALSLSSDYFLRVKSSDLTLLDTNNNKFSHLLGRKIKLLSDIDDEKLRNNENGISTEIELDGKTYRCNMWAAENNSNSNSEVSLHDRDFILKLHKKQEKENNNSDEIMSQVSDYNNNDQTTRRNSVSEYSENQDSTYLARLSESHKSHHGGRRRSSLAALNTRNLKKNPAISKLLLKINEAQHKYSSNTAISDDNHTEMMQELLSSMSHFLQNEHHENQGNQKITIQEKLEGEEHDLAKAMLNNNARTSISEKCDDSVSTKESIQPDTRRSSTFGATLAFTRNKRNTTGFSPLRENDACFDETKETTATKKAYNNRNTSPAHFSDNTRKYHNSISTPIMKMPTSIDYTPELNENIQTHTVSFASKDDENNEDIISELMMSQLVTRIDDTNENQHLVKNKAAIEEVLEDEKKGCTTWEFDAFKIEDLSNFSTLEVVGMRLFKEFNVIKVLGTDEKTALNWLKIIQANYRRSNTYHNATHASDVMQATANFLTHARCQKLLSPLDQAACLISAAVHDVDHRGKTNQFLCNSFDTLALLYNDKAVLENHHAATAFRLTLELDPKFNIFLNLEESQFKELRAIVIEMVLATEMSQHFDIVNKFIALASQDERGYSNSSSDDENNNNNNNARSSINSDKKLHDSVNNRRKSLEQTDPKQWAENQKLLVSLTRRMIIKVSDISNPVRPIKTGVKWTNRICEEYFQQTEEEQERQMPVVMPTFDRKTCNVPKSQIFFIDYFVRDMVDAWSDFINNDKMMKYLQDNQNFWRRMSDRDAISLKDLEEFGAEEMQKCEYLNTPPEVSLNTE